MFVCIESVLDEVHNERLLLCHNCSFTWNGEQCDIIIAVEVLISIRTVLLCLCKTLELLVSN